MAASSFVVPTVVVALAEIGDKTQLLSLLLAARFRKPVPIIVGILLATLLNHALAAMLGEWLRSLVDADTARWVLGLSLIAIAAWVLRPDKLENVESHTGRWGVFVVALISFFFAEIGDKTQIATIVMAAQYHALASVVLGTTLGMMIANVPVVLIGSAAAQRIPLHIVLVGAASMFAVMGVVTLTGIMPV